MGSTPPEAALTGAFALSSLFAAFIPIVIKTSKLFSELRLLYCVFLCCTSLSLFKKYPRISHLLNSEMEFGLKKSEQFQCLSL